MNMLWCVIIATGSIYLLIALLLFLFQDRLVYFPRSHPGPAIPPYREVAARTADGLELAGWVRPATGKPARAVICYHGNGGNRAHFTADVELVAAPDTAVYSFDWRGYGGNPGSPSEAGLYRDGEAMVARVRELTGLPTERIVLLGRSLGCAVAVELATRYAFDRVILLSPFTTMPDVAALHYPWLPVRLLLRPDYANLDKAPRVAEPVLVVAGARDGLVPAGMSRKLAEALPRARYQEVPGVGHNSLLGEGSFPRVRELVRSFLGGSAR